MIQKYFFKIALAFIIMLFIAGCGDDIPLSGDETEKELPSITSAVVSIPIEKIRTLNPVLSLDEDAYFLNNLVYEGLFALNKNLEAEGALAESCEYQGGGALLIRVKKGVLWQDGESFSAQDVKFSVDAYQSVPTNLRGSYGPAAALIKYAKVIDQETVLIQFADENNASLENLTFPILPAHKYKKPGDLARAEKEFIPLGTGPYWVSNFERNREITLTGNPFYKKDIPKNILHFKIMPKREEAVTLFDIGEISITFLKDIDRSTLIEDKAVTVVPFISNEAEVLGFNFNHGALQNRDVRKAIAHAIDNKSILETCYYSSGVSNDNIYYPGYMKVESEGPLYGYDINKATELLKSSGFEGLSLNLIFNSENQARNLAAQIIKSGLEKAGISVNLISLLKDEYEMRLRKGEFDLYLGGFKFNENYDLRPLLYTGGALNFIRYSDIKMDMLLDKMQQGLMTDEKRKTFETLHDYYKNEIPYYCLLYKTYGFAATTGLTGEIAPVFYNVYNGCESWRVTGVKPE